MESDVGTRQSLINKMQSEPPLVCVAETDTCKGKYLPYGLSKIITVQLILGVLLVLGIIALIFRYMRKGTKKQKTGEKENQTVTREDMRERDSNASQLREVVTRNSQMIVGLGRHLHELEEVFRTKEKSGSHGDGGERDSLIREFMRQQEEKLTRLALRETTVQEEPEISPPPQVNIDWREIEKAVGS